MLTAERLGKRYKSDWALYPLNLRLGPGMHGLLGPNGAGKSTLMRLLAGLLQPSSGDAMLDGVSVRDGRKVRSRIGYVPQVFRMYPQLTAREWLRHVARVKGLGGRAAVEEAVERTLHAVNLTKQADRPARTYSGGMIKRLGIGQALIGSPDVVIVDEPTAGLDPEERVRLRNVLAEAALTRTVLLSTHVLSDIQSSCRNLLVLSEGRLLYQGGPSGLASFADRRVWTWEASHFEWSRLRLDGLLSARETSDGIICRALGAQPPTPYAVQAEPTMEEGYISLISGRQAVDFR
ncbi:ATP-binding cassette domain-containing protein [Paenibacillus cisolokensis]|uniref:ATP-binding cassette domain-containing protein n=1 Tax=Paenibacillus cisolokensis TaxID=1658519 RepID=UPI003D2E4276